MMASMLVKYIEVLNRGGVPNISSAWEHILENECINAYTQSLDLYMKLLSENFNQNEPRTFEELF